MKIFQTNFFNYPLKSTQIVPYKRQENNQDTFTRSTNPISFKGDDENSNLYRQVMQNPTMTQKVMELITTAATILVAKASGIMPPSNKENIDTEKICNDVIKEENEKTQIIETYQQEIKELKKENSRLKKLNETTKQEENHSEILDTDVNESESDPSITEQKINKSLEADAEKQNKYIFEFPKKKAGVLSKLQKELKEVTTHLDLDEAAGTKLAEICKELLNNNSHKIDDTVIDNKEITKDFVEKLSKETPENLNEIIDDFYAKCELGTKDNNLNSDTNSEKSDLHDNTKEKEQTEIFETKKVKLPGVTVKGKINLEDINSTTNVKSDAAKTTSAEQKREKRPRIPKTELLSDNTDTTSEIEVIHENDTSYTFIIPGTVNKNVILDLKKLLLHFEKQVEKDNPKPLYRYNQSLGVKISENDILNELRKKYGNERYRNINKNNISEVADAINSDPRFGKMFTLHAAMRLIDRFADFNSDTTLDKQCHHILNKLTEILQISFKDGLKVCQYTDKKDPNKKIGMRVFISENVYDDEAKAIFGNYNFGLGICENQPIPNYYNKRIKNPLICTIFVNEK